MTRIGPSEQILLLLRERLERMDRPRAEASSSSEPLAPQARISALAGLRDLPERSFRRAVIRGLLAEQLGDELAGDPAFEGVVGQVLDLVEGNPDTAALLWRTTEALRGDV